MKIYNKVYFKSRIIIELIFLFLIIYYFPNVIIYNNDCDKRDIKIALCTMGRMENLYVKEFIEYYVKLGIDHLFIFNDNEPYEESIYNGIDEKYKNKVTIYDAKLYHIDNQMSSFSKCYNDNMDKFDWFIMVDMDEFLFIVDDSLKNYLTNKRFYKCDFIKIHWVIPKDNGLIYYDSRPLFERFRPPFIKSDFIKSIIRGNISGLKYWVHSPYISPKRNITCNNIGKRIYFKKMNFERIRPINIKKAYIIHFMFKSTEELINKIKRGYKNWLGDYSKNNLINKLKQYFSINKATFEKIKFIEEELNLNLSDFIKDITKIKI